MRKFAVLTLALPAMLALAACESSVAPAGTLSDEDLQDLAAALESVAQGAMTTSGPSFSESAEEGTGPRPIATTFTMTVGCPVSGTLSIAAESKGEVDRATHSMTLATTATVTHDECAVRNRRGVTITVNGNPNVVMTSNIKVVDGRPSGIQTSTQKGAFTWSTTEGASGTCEIDVTSSFDPDTRTRTVSGTNCGRTINFTRTRTD